MRLFITGDCHAEYDKLIHFAKQNSLTEDDYILVCGDFGIWEESQKKTFAYLERIVKPTILFVDGNHENYDMLNEYPSVEWNGGMVHRITSKLIHLKRGYVFTIGTKKFFTFGGARSHDIQDGILRLEDYKNRQSMMDDYRRKRRLGKMVRVEHVSWWEEEMPTQEEMWLGNENLYNNDNRVDYIITHCLPTDGCKVLSGGFYEEDELTNYLSTVALGNKFSRWFCGHYHVDFSICGYTVLYDSFVEVEI